MEIIPNWHPLLVHFTVALLPIAAGFYVMAVAVKGRFQEQWLTVANWTLWAGMVFSLLTVASGIYAYNTVDHDTPSHVAMTLHRNWALATFLLYVLTGIWALVQFRKNKAPHPAFLGLLIIAFLVLASTAWRGGELVYRHGLGVMSLPKSEGEGHAHDHGDAHNHDHTDDDGGGTPAMSDDHHADSHSHDAAEPTVQEQHHDDEHHHENEGGAAPMHTDGSAMPAATDAAVAPANTSDHHHDDDSHPHAH